jgi:predicted transcriptional regulator of viral defense system
MGDPKRRRKSPAFVMLYHKWMSTAAWAALSGIEVKLLVEMLRLYRGDNNGHLGLGQYQAAATLGVARNTAARAFEGLEEKGFIRPTRKGCFDVKGQQTEWRVTMWPAFGKVATHDYLKWSAEEKA